MKKLLIAFAAITSILIYAASSQTTHYNLIKPADGDSNWGDGYRANLDTIDNQMFINATGLSDHITDPVDAHTASAIGSVPGSLVCSNQITVQDYLDCLDAQVGAITTGTVVTTNTDQTITGQKDFSTTPIFSSMSTGLVHSDISGALTSSLLVNSDVDPLAGISYGKLFLTDSIVNSDINSSAAIEYSKLDLADSIVNADISSAAAISYSKLNLANSIVDADIGPSAAISKSKIASGTAHRPLVNDASGVISELGPLTNGQLLIGSTGAAPVPAAITGTANQITVTNSAGGIQLSTPQNIGTGSSVQFGTALVGTGSLSSTAVLQANSTTRGFLPPRMTEAQRDAIAAPSTGLVIYNTTSSSLEFYNGSIWVALAASLTNPMDSIGDMIYGGASGAVTKLDSGSAGQILTSNGAAAPSWETPTVVTSGTYSPTVTNVTNSTSPTASGFSYLRIGSIVKVAGQVSSGCTTAGGTSTTIRITLPVATDITAAAQLSGVGGSVADGTAEGLRIIGDTANDAAEFTFTCRATGSHGRRVMFQYEL
jgi:hypothetical protein